MPHIQNEREAIEILIRNGVDADDNSKVVLHSKRVPGLRLLRAIDYLVNRCQYNKLGEVATESFLKARKIHEDRVRKSFKGKGQ